MLHHRLISGAIRLRRPVGLRRGHAREARTVGSGIHFGVGTCMCNAEGCLTRIGDAASDISASDQVHFTEKGSVFLVQSIIDRLVGESATAGKPAHRAARSGAAGHLAGLDVKISPDAPMSANAAGSAPVIQTCAPSLRVLRTAPCAGGIEMRTTSSSSNSGTMPVISATSVAWASTSPIRSAFCSPVEASRAGMFFGA